MRDEITLAYEFVEFIPEELTERTLYISQKYATAIHTCCCGCGRQVVTPLAPNRWQLNFDGRTVSLYPSIGNWSMPCKSHYYITNSKVLWVETLIEQVVGGERPAEISFRDDRHRKKTNSNTTPFAGKSKESLWGRIRRWIFGNR